MIEKLKTGSLREIRSILERIDPKDPGMIKGLLELIDQPDMQLQQMVMNYFIRAGWPVMNILVETLKDRRPTKRAMAILILGRMGAVTAIPEMLKSLGDGDDRVSSAASLALGQICSPNNIPALVEKLCDDRSRESAASAIDTMLDKCVTSEQAGQIDNKLQEGLGRLRRPPRPVRRRVSKLRKKAAKTRKRLAADMGGVILVGEKLKPPENHGDKGSSCKVLRFRR